MTVELALHPKFPIGEVSGAVLTVIAPTDKGTRCPRMKIGAEGLALCGVPCYLVAHEEGMEQRKSPVFSTNHLYQLIETSVLNGSVGAVFFQGDEPGYSPQQVLRVAEMCHEAEIPCGIISQFGLQEHSKEFAELGGWMAISVNKTNDGTEAWRKTSIDGFLSVDGAGDRLFSSMVLNPDTVDEQLKVVSYIRDLGIQYLGHNPQTVGLDTLAHTADVMQPIADQVRAVAEAAGLNYFFCNEVNQAKDLTPTQLIGQYLPDPDQLLRFHAWYGVLAKGLHQVCQPLRELDPLSPDCSELPI